MPLDRVIQPSVPPLHALALRGHVRQDIADDDGRLDYWIRAAARAAETKCRRTLIASRYKLTLDAFPSSDNSFAYGNGFSVPPSAILLERGPVLAVQSIKYLALDGTLQTLASTEYVVDLSGQVARITPRFGKVWPANVMPQIGSVQVLYDAGDAAGISVNPATDIITILGGIWKPLTVGDTVRFTNSGGALPTPLAVDTDYFVQSLPTASSLTLSATSGGALLDITGAGTGQSYIGAVSEDVGAWMQLHVGTNYENRTKAVQLKGVFVEIPQADSLLDEATIRLY